MPVRTVQFVQGHYYHLHNRGANRQSIFHNDDDFRDFLTRLKGNTQKYAVQIIAYCLMPNHFHLLVRQDGETSAGLALQYTCNGYTQHFNRQRQRQGTLFQGRFGAHHVHEDAYLRHLCCYIHANPVKDGFALKPELWPYSNYLEWTGQRNGSLIDKEFVKTQFGSAETYKNFVTAYMTNAAAIPANVRTYLASLAG